MTPLEWGSVAFGVLVVGGSLLSLVTTLVVPRGVTSRFAAAVAAVTDGAFRLVSRPLRSYPARDRLFTFLAPFTLLALFASWLGSIGLGFALVLLPFVDGGLSAALREAGSSLLTLGFASSAHRVATALDIGAAAIGLLVVALEIAYLPVLYGAFSRRETLVTMLDSRAGTPAWGPELLWRHNNVGLTPSLPDFYAAWEQWCADVAESHTTYPILVRFRSPHPLRSWLTGLLAVMDSAALYLAFCPAAAPVQARLCLRMGFTCLRDVARVLRMPFDPDPSPDTAIELTREEFDRAAQMLQQAGFPLERTSEQAWAHFRGWRVNYESIAYRLADRVMAPPGPWSGTRRDLPGVRIEPSRPADRKPST